MSDSVCFEQSWTNTSNKLNIYTYDLNHDVTCQCDGSTREYSVCVWVTVCVISYWLNVELEVQVTEVPDLIEALL